MGTTITLDSELIALAKSYSAMQSRSVPKQIAHWAKIGRLVEENPELSYSMIRSILLGMEDVKNGAIEEYKPGML